MKLLYKPLGIISGVVGGKLGKNVFEKLWARLDGGKPPVAGTEEATVGKVVTARALEAATLAGVAAAVDRASMHWFHYLFGIWPGETAEDAAQARAKEAEEAAKVDQ